MNFAQYRKTLRLEHVDTLKINLNLIKVQYNPDLFKHWQSVCGDSMEINSTPYYYYLKYRKVDKYFDLMRLYGRTDDWIKNNINKFFKLRESISKHGIKELPVILTKPIINNEYSKDLEIWEGHRRLSICLYDGIQQEVKLCRIV